MTRLLEEYLGSCDRKIRFPEKWEADIAVWMHEATYLERMRSYPCWFCGYWHIGHERPSPQYILMWAFQRAAHFFL